MTIGAAVSRQLPLLHEPFLQVICVGEKTMSHFLAGSLLLQGQTYVPVLKLLRVFTTSIEFARLTNS